MKYGRRPPKNTPSLKLAPLLTGVVPVHPPSVDYLAKLSNWQMLGNDQYGDCVAVTWANVRRLVTATLGSHETYPTLAQVETLYKTQNPGFPSQDNGMDIQTCLEYLVKTGGPDGVKAVAFAQIDHTNIEEVKAAEAVLGYVWPGINVLRANEQEFSRGQPWDYVRNSPVVGGHSIIAGGYTGQSANDVRFITWGKETGFTDSFWTHQVEEAWVVIWPEHLGSAAFQQGIDLNALAADYQALTGRTLPIVPPPPVDQYQVRPEIRAAMVSQGDSPAADEAAQWLANGSTFAGFDSAVGVSGNLYLWIESTRKVAIMTPSKVV